MKTPYKMKKSPINKGYAAKPSPMLQTTDKDDIIQAVKRGDTSRQTSSASTGIPHDVPYVTLAGPYNAKVTSGSDIDYPRTYATSTNIPASTTQGTTKETTYKELAAKGGLYTYTGIQEGRGKGFFSKKSQADLKNVYKKTKSGGTRIGKRKLIKKIGSRFVPGLGWGMALYDVFEYLSKPRVWKGNEKDPNAITTKRAVSGNTSDFVNQTNYHKSILNQITNSIK